MKKLLCYAVLPLVLLMIFSVLLHLDILLKNGLADQKFVDSLHELQDGLQREEDVTEQLEELTADWQNIRRLLVIAVSSDESGELDQSLARIKGQLRAGLPRAALAESYLTEEIWNGLGK